MLHHPANGNVNLTGSMSALVLYDIHTILIDCSNSKFKSYWLGLSRFVFVRLDWVKCPRDPFDCLKAIVKQHSGYF